MDQGRGAGRAAGGPLYVPPGEAEAAGLLARARRRLGWMRDRWLGRAAAAGLPPAVLGQRYRRHVPAEAAAAARDEVHPARTVAAPLPVTGQGRQALAADPGWFGFSFRDVPARAAAATEVLTLTGARLLAGADAAGEFAPAILDASGPQPRSARDPLPAVPRPPGGPRPRPQAPPRRLDRRAGVRQLRALVHRASGQARAAARPRHACRPGAAGGPPGLARRQPRADRRRRPPPSCPAAGCWPPTSWSSSPATGSAPSSSGPPATPPRIPPGGPDARVFVSRRSARGRRLVGEDALMPLLRAPRLRGGGDGAAGVDRSRWR